MPTPKLSVDIGGTFTDLVLSVGDRVHTRKVLTTPAMPDDAFLQGMDLILHDADVGYNDLSLIIHGTTLATNALIERKGARCAMLVTEGFRDSVEMAYENRFEQYDILMERPPPLVARHLRLPIRERLGPAGQVITPLDEDAIIAAIDVFRRHDIQSVAICFLHSYANLAHEKRAREILQSHAPDLSITMSGQVSPEIREYERWSTACANAYVQPVMDTYLGRLETRLHERGVMAPLFMVTSSGSLATCAHARHFPIRLVESGPAGGAVLAVALAAYYGLPEIVSFDMGGTTAKICLIDNNQPLFSRFFEVARHYRHLKGSGLPIRIPVIDMVEIGAGGGSVATVDAMKRIQVGPQSMGSTPGPACYGRGGTCGTVTDANVVCGRIRAETFAGGSMKLDTTAAQSALVDAVGMITGQSPAAAASSVIEIVEESMANAARVHAMEKGCDLTSRTMIAFGGAAPLHASRLAEKLGIRQVIVPTGAGVGSAIGFLLTPIACDIARTHLLTLDATSGLGALERLHQGMLDEAHAVIGPAIRGDLNRLEARWVADMRYHGQGHEVQVHITPTRIRDPDTLRTLFEAAYARQFGRTIPNLAVQITGWTLRLSAPVDARLPPPSGIPTTGTAQPVMGRIIAPGTSRQIDVAIYQRAELPVTTTVNGPALIVEDETTTFVSACFGATINELGHIVMTRIEA